MWTSVESGIHGKLLNISYKPQVGKVYEPYPLTIHGNIAIQFVYLSGGLLLALLIFIVELRQHILLLGVRFGLLMRNMLISFLKSLLGRLKYHQVKLKVKYPTVSKYICWLVLLLHNIIQCILNRNYGVYGRD